MDFVVGCHESAIDEGRTTELDVDSSRPLDGKSPMEWDSTAAARSAADGQISTVSGFGFRPGTTTRTGSDDLDGQKERPNGVKSLDLSTPQGDFTNGGVDGI